MRLKYYCLLIFLAFVVGCIDEHPLSSVFITFFLLLFGDYQQKKLSIDNRACFVRLFAIVTSVYLISAFIVSFGFTGSKQLIFGDVYSYTKDLSLTRFDIDVEMYLKSGFFMLEDGNVLHEVGYRFYIIFANNYLDGASVFNLTYIHSIFGILSIGVFYRILLNFFNPNKAYTYALFFAFLSPFFVYSIVVLRDIVIAFLYLLIFEIILTPFKWSRLFILLVYMILTIGIRLYSGLFVFSFVGYYLYRKITSSKFRVILIPVFWAVIVVLSLNYVIYSDIFSQSTEELQGYIEFDADRSTGFTSKLNSLPQGIKEISLSLYSQIHPFPFYELLRLAHSIPLFILALIKSVSVLWWYFVFFGLCYALFFKRKIKLLPQGYMYLLIIAFIFIAFNSIQIDVRRIMAVYPLIYLLYLITFKYYNQSALQVNCHKFLGVLYFVMLIVYFVIIQK